MDMICIMLYLIAAGVGNRLLPFKTCPADIVIRDTVNNIVQSMS